MANKGQPSRIRRAGCWVEAFGATNDYCYNVTKNPVGVHDLHATLLHLLGIDHKRLTFKSQGRHYRLTGVEGNLVREVIAQAIRKGKYLC